MLTTFVIVGIHSTIYWGNLMSIEAILILQLSLSVIGLLVRWNVGSLVGTSDALFWLTRSKHLEKFEIPSGKSTIYVSFTGYRRPNHFLNERY